jgi:hypothetical protein
VPAPLGQKINDRAASTNLTSDQVAKDVIEELIRPESEHCRPEEYWWGFIRTIEALSQNDRSTAEKHLQQAIELEATAQQLELKAFGDAPLARLCVHSVQYLLGHARALEQLTRRIENSRDDVGNHLTKPR